MLRVHLMRVLDYSFMNLKGDEREYTSYFLHTSRILLRINFCPGSTATPTRNHVFHITFPKQWKTSDIIQLFSPYGKNLKLLVLTKISW